MEAVRTFSVKTGSIGKGRDESALKIAMPGLLVILMAKIV